MKLTLLRFSDNGDDTLGLYFLDGKFFSYVLEDEFRSEKIKGDTRIDAGTYDLVCQEQMTPMTAKYKNKFNWFEWHIMIKDLPRHTSVYIHIGNKDEDTMGCLLPGDEANNNQSKKGFIQKSTKAFERLYKTIYPAVKAGNAKIEIVDFDRMYQGLFKYDLKALLDAGKNSFLTKTIDFLTKDKAQ